MTEEIENKYVKEEEEKLPESLVKGPYKYICNFYEEMFPQVGNKVFSILSLVPISLIIPEIEAELKPIKRTLTMLWIAPPGSAKTVISEEFAKITKNPISSHKMTPARLIYEIKERKNSGEDELSLIISDTAVMFNDEVMIKIIESAVEEGTISWETMRTIKDKTLGGFGTDKKIRVVSYLSGTPSLISDRKIRDGILGRAFPLITYLTPEQHKEALEKKNSSIGKKFNGKTLHHIQDFYKKLYDIQKGVGELPKIDGFVISEEIKKELGKYIIKESVYLDKIFERWGVPGFRIMEEGYIFLVSHAFLNIFSREIVDNKIIVDWEDLKIAKKLIKIECYFSYRIYEAIAKIDMERIKTEEELRKYFFKNKDKNIPESTKVIMRGLVKR